MNRRSFLQRIGATAIGLTLARHLPGIAPQAPTLSPPEEWAAGSTLRAGDMFTIEGLYAKNPITGQSTAHLQYFVATADVTSGNTPIPTMPVANRPLFLSQVTPSRTVSA